ncbi:MAG: hypothetical protein K0S11_163 [Gammaproteobacteria bacterium]|jgi:glycosyltransferase involved in cell wall biosynthesis|nr:hypothetical protein [Gammaproteobacteria bacterium]
MDQRVILFFADRLPPLIGGMEMHGRYFIEHFSDHKSLPLTGIVTKTPNGEDCLIAKNHKYVIDIEKLPTLVKPDILFFNSGKWIEELIELRHLFPSAYFIYRTGGNEILKAPLARQAIFEHKLRQAYWASSLNQAIDLLITNSNFTEARLREIGIKCAFARCIGGVNPTALKSKSSIQNNSPLRLFCAARFVAYKNHELLLSVFHELILRGQDICLHLAGDGPLLDDIKRQVKAYKLESVVKFLGALDNEAVCQEITSADVYIQLSTDYLTKVPGGTYIHTEGMGRSILEALSAGTFVIAGKSGALPEMVSEDRGLLVDVNDRTAITDKIEQTLKQLPSKLPPIEDYSWANLFSRYEEIMMRLTK